jgi:glycosyltransferase involved in cell wall biosynthesis
VRIAAVIPAHNEAATIVDVACRARSFVLQVAVIDDGSTDGTAQCVKDLDVTLLRNAANQGKAASLWRGMQWALDAGAEMIVTLDGDGQHRPQDIPRLLEVAARYPGAIVIGARLRGRARAPRRRRYANAFADFWISWAAGHRIADSQSGFRLYPAELLRRIRVAHDREHGFVFESEILIEAARLGVRSVSVEIDAVYAAARASHYRAATDTWRIVRMVAWSLIRRGLYPRGLMRVLRTQPELVDV